MERHMSKLTPAEYARLHGSQEATVIHQAVLEELEMGDMPEHIVAAKRRLRPLEQFGCVVTSTPTIQEASDLFHALHPLGDNQIEKAHFQKAVAYGQEGE